LRADAALVGDPERGIAGNDGVCLTADAGLAGGRGVGGAGVRLVGARLSGVGPPQPLGPFEGSLGQDLAAGAEEEEVAHRQPQGFFLFLAPASPQPDGGREAGVDQGRAEHGDELYCQLDRGVLGELGSGTRDNQDEHQQCEAAGEGSQARLLHRGAVLARPGEADDGVHDADSPRPDEHDRGQELEPAWGAAGGRSYARDYEEKGADGEHRGGGRVGALAEWDEGATEAQKCVGAEQEDHDVDVAHRLAGRQGARGLDTADQADKSEGADREGQPAPRALALSQPVP